MSDKTQPPCRLRWLVLVLATVGLAACGRDDGTATTSSADTDLKAGSEEAGEQILIKTEVKIVSAEELPDAKFTGSGEVLEGSSIADAPFCPDGTFRDKHSEDTSIGFVDRTFECPDGTLRVGFSPGPPTTPLTQSGPWHVVSGTGAFKGLEAQGQMEIEYEPHTQTSQGRETFTGTAAP